jgi:hypothetical protein
MKGRIHRAPLALTSDGTVVANVAHVDAHFDEAEDAHAALERALDGGRDVFISVALSPEEIAFVQKRVDDSGADALAWLIGKARESAKASGKNQRRRRATARKSRSTAS